MFFLIIYIHQPCQKLIARTAKGNGSSTKALEEHVRREKLNAPALNRGAVYICFVATVLATVTYDCTH